MSVLNKIENLKDNIGNKSIEPKIYAIVTSIASLYRNLVITIAYSLEEAFYVARKETLKKIDSLPRYNNITPDILIKMKENIEVNLDMWVSKTFSQLESEVLEDGLSFTKMIEYYNNDTENKIKYEKSKLMVNIIKNRDKKLYNKNKKKFNSYEKKYIENEINDK